MTTQELIEAAVLDALGLLDEEERAAFEAAFRSAPPSVQAHVRREQTRLARIESYLPQVEAPPGLRARVLARVRAAMEDAAILSPKRSEPHAVLPLIPNARVSPLWRAAAYGFATAAVLALAGLLMLRAQYNDIGDLIAQNNRVDSTIRDLGDTVLEFIGRPSVHEVNFVSIIGNDETSAKLYFDRKPDDVDEIMIVCRNLPIERGRTYRLVITDRNGQIGETLVTFQTSGGLDAPHFSEIELDAEDAGLAIVAVDTDGGSGPEPVLTLDQMH